MRRLSSLFLALLVACAVAGAPSRADEAPPGAEPASPAPGRRQGAGAGERAGQEALNRGLAWLAQRQRETANGSFPKGRAREWAPIGVASLGTLAYLAGGSSLGRGPYRREVARAVEYLLAHAALGPESEHRGYISDGSDQLSRTHGHGYATLALAQAYGMSPAGGARETGVPTNRRLERVLTAAVRLIEDSQGAEGGWEYTPQMSANHEGSVTVCLVQALRAARNAGLKVDSEVIHKAEDYVLRLQKEDGSFRYQLDAERSSVALTAACIGTLNMAGRYDDRVIQSGVDAIWNRLERRRRDGDPADYPFYERLYLAQALWQLSDRSLFDRWYAETRTELIRRQRPDGSWENAQYGDCYATAMNCLVLAIPGGLLPIFQR